MDVFNYQTMSILEQEIIRIASNDRMELSVIRGSEKDEILNRIKSVFVLGEPRAFWLSFRYFATLLEYDQDYPYLKLAQLVDRSENLYFLIDDFNERYHLLEGKIQEIVFFIEDCEGLDEYYVISSDFQRLICENDHDELLYIDINKNSERNY